MYEHLIKLQKRLAEKLVICPYENDVKLVAGVDVSFDRYSNIGFCSIVVLDKMFNIVEAKFHKMGVKLPYIPGLLSFRELPLIMNTFKKLVNVPDIIICDAQGVAHPRGLGLASHLGIVLKIPTIGCAKNRLVGEYDVPPDKKGAYSILYYKGKEVGAVLRIKEGCRPVFVSPGNLIDINSSLTVIMKYVGKYKLPEPTRIAHIYSNKLRRSELI
ncbi:endonuclease V [Deferribacteraceae bacterium V6Fe1]|nr:endonuclease V [Deferribacteraceae bacterium V6Fe1]